MVTYNILVTTPQAQFGEMIRLTLEETGLYRVRLVPNGSAALASCQLLSFAVAILDCDLPEQSAIELARQLRDMQPGLKVVLLPPGNNRHHPMLNGFESDGFIDQPFFIPDMLEQMASLTGSTPQVENAPPLPPPWLDDKEHVFRVFNRVFTTLTAQGGILVRGKEPWCVAGRLSAGAAGELAGWLARYTTNPTQTDLARFIHLNSQSVDVLVYGVTLASGVILALVFPPGTPLTRVSAQTRQCVLDLTHQLAQDRDDSPLTSTSEDEYLVPGAAEGKSASELAFEAFLSTLPPPEPAPEPESETQFVFPWEMTPPPPEQNQSDWVPLIPRSPEQPQTASPQSLADQAEQPAQVQEEPAPAEITETPPLTSIEPLTKAVETAAQPETPQTGEPVSQPEEPEPAVRDASLADTQPVRLSPPAPADAAPPANPDQPEPTPPAEAPPADPDQPQPTPPAVEAPPATSEQPNPIYTCFLLPCRPEHTLHGPTADFLINWLPQLCLAFNWNLLHLEVNLDYLQWQVQLSPETLPNNVVRTVRKLSTQRLFNLNARYQSENSSGDFWAPGFLIISGAEPPPAAVVRRFIHQTRHQQGLVN